MAQYITMADFAKQYPERCDAPVEKLSRRGKYACQCRSGHIFDYRRRIKFPTEDKGFAPCQGKCPSCGTTEFFFLGSASYYLIKKKWHKSS